jgi:hypothetical protein
MTSALQLIEQIRTALADDAAITAWCTEQFGKAQTVFIDVDEQHPPDPASDYPAIVVLGLGQVRGDSQREISWELEIGVGVVNEEIVSAGNTRIMTGFCQAETLRELAEDAIYRAGIGGVTTRAESGSASFFPLFISGSVIPITQLKPNRRAMPGRT